MTIGGCWIQGQRACQHSNKAGVEREHQVRRPPSVALSRRRRAKAMVSSLADPGATSAVDDASKRAAVWGRRGGGGRAARYNETPAQRYRGVTGQPGRLTQTTRAPWTASTAQPPTLFLVAQVGARCRTHPSCMSSIVHMPHIDPGPQRQNYHPGTQYACKRLPSAYRYRVAGSPTAL